MEENNQNNFNNQPMPEQPMTQMNNQPMPSTEPTKNNKMLFIIIGAVTALAILVAVYFLVIKKDDNTTNDDGKVKVKEIINLKEKINITHEQLPDGNLLITTVNNNNEAVSVDLEINYYDINNALVDTDEEDIHLLFSSRKAYLPVTMSDKKFEKIEIKIKECETIDYYIDHYNDVTILVSDNNEELLVQAKNNSEGYIDNIELITFFYKNDKLVSVQEDFISKINANETSNGKVRYPYNHVSYDKMEFDSYEVKVVNAYSSKY